MPTSKNTSSNGAPKRSAIRLDMMPASTSTAPNRMVRLTESIDAMPLIGGTDGMNATIKDVAWGSRVVSVPSPLVGEGGLGDRHESKMGEESASQEMPTPH